MAAASGFLGHRTGFAPRRYHSLVCTLKISVFDLPDDVENLADVPALMIGPAKTSQEVIFKS